MKKWIAAIAVLTLGTTLAIAAPNGDHEGGRRHGRHQFGAKFAEKLGLSDAQKQQVRDIKQASRESNKPLFESHRQTMQDFRAAKQAGDTAKADALKSTLESQRAQLKQIHEADMQKVLSILTPDQRAKFDAMKAERAARRQQEQQR